MSRIDSDISPWWLLAAIVAAAGVWIYAQRVLIPFQIADAAAHERPRGNFSDLYPRWLGAREMLLNGRDPYGTEVTREIQQGYYGRALDAGRTSDPQDQQGFAYPAYVVFLLAPTVRFSFVAVSRGFFWFLFLATAATVPLWLRLLQWDASPRLQMILIVLTLGSLAVMQGLKLEQMTLLVAALLTVSIVLLVTGHSYVAGAALALATIKPQLVCLLLLWLLIWAMGDWWQRYRWLLSFLFTMLILCAAAEFFLPHWVARFFQAMRAYQSYTGGASILDALVPAPFGLILRLASLTIMARVAWKNRRVQQDSPEFMGVAVLALAITVLIIPSYHLYDQVLLLPALLFLLQRRQSIWSHSRWDRIGLILTAIFLVWPWLVCIVLGGVSFILPSTVVWAAWAVPFWTVLVLPPVVAALVLMADGQRTFTASSAPEPS